MKQMLLTILLLCMLPLAGEAKQKLYKWVDKEGITHYSAHPPVNQEVETVDIRVGRGGKSQPAQPPRAEPPAKTQEKIASAPADTQTLKDADKCKKVREDLNNLRTYPRVRIKDPTTGELRYMSPEEKELRLKLSEQQEKEFCDD